MNLLVGAITIGLICAPLALGVFLSYRVFRTLDLTTDGSFGVGAAVAAALLTHGVHPIAATILGSAAGAAAGATTGLLHTRLAVSMLLAGVLTSTSLYSAILFIMGGGNLSLASADSVGAVAERLARLAGLPADVTVLGTNVSRGSVATLLGMALVAVALVFALARLLETDLGLAMRASGTNAQMARSVDIEVGRMTVVGIALANALVALTGALLAQYQGFASIDMGIGALVMGVASLLIGETLFGRRPLGRWLGAAAAGALVFRLLVAGAVRAGLNPNALKAVTALLLLVVLVTPALATHRRRPAPAAAQDHAS